MRTRNVEQFEETIKKSKFAAPAKKSPTAWHSWYSRNIITQQRVGLPIPPDPAEKFYYDQKSQKWQIFWQVLSVTGIISSFLMFSRNNVLTNFFYLPTAFFVLFALVSLLTLIRAGGEWDFELHADRVGLYRKSKHLPSVDVFLPSAGEDLAVLENTYRWVAEMDWPLDKLEVYVLDDSDRLEVARLAELHGFNYFVRPNRGYLKKAGNLLYGFKRSHGDLIAIFDADFVPSSDFLYEIGHYFENPNIGIVQSPQFFDTDATMNWIQRTAGAVQELFYRAIQVSRSKIGSPICCGTSAVYRRAALEEAGGFVQIEHSEDVYTGIALRRQGYKTIYVPAVLTKGLCPDGAKAFFNQQYRWCAGSMTLMRDPDFWKAPIPFMQRLCYISGFLYFMFTAMWLFLGYVPVLTMIIFLPDEVKLINYLPLLPSMIYAWIIQPNWHRSKYGFEVQSIRALTAYAHFFAIKDIFTDNLQGWIPTGEAGVSTDRFSFFREINLIWGSVTASIMLVGPILRVLCQGYAWYDWTGIFIFGLLSASVFYKVQHAPGSGK